MRRMKNRFEGDDGKRLLSAVLKAGPIAGGDEAIAERLIAAGELIELERDKVVIEQGAADNDIFFIIAGPLDIYVNGRYVGTREPRSYVGEMSLIDPSARRSATVVARDGAVL